ncbi:acetolactate synthase small subunit [Paenibacillus sedimenti]|uniref:Acetolactate synthase small subunit n=1 Tax=Paenibacillus sedimenti TaxID=2770274 RepID=A0A926KRL0_9BACL|nr:acetolactate synthase small subunit [Paenibacillus sedimenti]MBD0380780.1 acetolactate synthase small subunit [Paenibacillus sedimenti]
MQNSYLLSLLVNDHPRVLHRICVLFSKRGFNIASITVGPSEDSSLARMTIQTYGDAGRIDQMAHQLKKLIDVIHIEPIVRPYALERELLLLSVKSETAYARRLARIVEEGGGKIVNKAADRYAIEISGDTESLERFLRRISEFPIVQLARTGLAAISLKS